MNPTAGIVFTEHIQRELRGTNSELETRAMIAYSTSDMIEAMTGFLNDVIDQINEYELDEHTTGTFADACETVRLRLLGRPDALASPIIGLMALLCLNAKLLHRRFGSPDTDEQQQAETYCRSLFTNGHLSRAIKVVYAPDPNDEAAERFFWDAIDFDSLYYHRAGTTSFILGARESIPANTVGSATKLAIKCVLFPWNKLKSISKATGEYTKNYGVDGVSRGVVQPIASSQRWVMMPFQEGDTLGEDLGKFFQSEPSMAERIDKCRLVAMGLVDALKDLAEGNGGSLAPAHRKHLDLSPSNVIIDSDTGKFRLIDLGVNHLYSRQVGIAEHDDAVYIAPEVKNRHPISSTADVYSLGIILMQILAGAPPRDGRTPDVIWTASPILAETLEDLIEEHAERRLLALAPGVTFTYDALGEILARGFEQAALEPVAQHKVWSYRWALIAPSSREPTTQFRQWNAARAHGDGDSYILFFTALSTIAWTLIAARTAIVNLGDILVGKYESPPEGKELYANVIALSQALVAAKFYQTILARLTLRGLKGSRARATEVVIRSMTIVAVPTTLLSTLSSSMYWVWPWTCVAGALAVALGNWLTYTMANRLFNIGATRLSTVPEASSRFARGYEQWWWTMLLYALIISVLATGVQIGAIHDVGACVFVLVAITLGVHYGTKCAAAGPAVRGSLARAFSIGQRVAKIEQRQGAPVP